MTAEEKLQELKEASCPMHNLSVPSCVICRSAMNQREEAEHIDLIANLVVERLKNEKG